MRFTRHAAIVLALALALALSACAVQPLYFRLVNHAVPIVPMQSFEYAPAHGQFLDAYPARNAKGPAPVVLFFYGGTWRDGRREYYRFVGESLSSHGVLVLVPDYRKAPQDVFPAFMEDAAQAAAWAKAHAAELGGDPSRIHLMGHSAGAHMVALLAADPHYLAQVGLRPRDFASVIGLSGPYDFLPITELKVQRVFPDRASWPATQPVNFIDGDEPPFLLLHGASDRRVWTENSVHMAEKLRAAGVPVKLKIEARTGHIAMVNGFRSPRFSSALADTLDWINGGEEETVAAAQKKKAPPEEPATPLSH